MRIVLIGSFGSSDDQHYRMNQPAAALAADLLVLTMTLDLEAFRLIRQRRLLGRPTVVEVNDYLPDVQAWNPAAGSWRDPRGQKLFHGLIHNADACQFSCGGLAERLQQQARSAVVFPNHLDAIPGFDALKHRADGQPLRIGWGGSIGHLEDLRYIAPALLQWMLQRSDIQFEIMADPSLAAAFEGMAEEHVLIRSPGSLDHSRDWLNSLHIGLAPLLPTDYNRCRSDVKFLDYAAAELQNEPPYKALAATDLASLFDSPETLIQQLESLVQNPEQRLEQARCAHAYVSTNRDIQTALVERQTFYTGLLQHSDSVPGALPAPLEQQRERTPMQIPGWERIGERHCCLNLSSSDADQGFAKALKTLQSGHWSAATDHLQAGDPECTRPCPCPHVPGVVLRKTGPVRRGQPGIPQCSSPRSPSAAERHHRAILDHVHGHTNQSILLSRQGQWPEAQAACQRALAIDPGFLPAQRQQHHLAEHS